VGDELKRTEKCRRLRGSANEISGLVLMIKTIAKDSGQYPTICCVFVYHAENL